MTMLPDIDEQAWRDDESERLRKEWERRQAEHSFRQNVEARVSSLNGLFEPETDIPQPKADLSNWSLSPQRPTEPEPRPQADLSNWSLTPPQRQQAEPLPEPVANWSLQQPTPARSEPSPDYRMQVPAAARAAAPEPPPARGAEVGPYKPGNKASFIEAMTPLAREYEARTGIPAEYFLAVNGSESNWGNAPGNMLFGIKARPGRQQTGPVGTWEQGQGAVQASFSAYGSPDEAYADFTDLISSGRYAPAWQQFQKDRNPDTLFANLNKAGYATDPQWGSKISSIARGIGDVGGAVEGVGRNLPGAVGQWVAQRGKDISQFGDPTLTPAEAAAACGPAAAVRFAQMYGRTPTLREATDLAKTVGWDEGKGMAGIGSEQALLKKMGVETELVSGPQWERFAAEAQTKNPVTISTSAHYFFADDYNPRTGQFHVGSSGTDLRGGKEWMTRQEIEAAAARLGGGQVQGALLANNPTVQTPSGAGAATDPAAWLGRQKDDILSSLTGARQSAEQRIADAVTSGRALYDQTSRGFGDAVGGLTDTIRRTIGDTGEPTADYGNLGPSTAPGARYAPAAPDLSQLGHALEDTSRYGPLVGTAMTGGRVLQPTLQPLQTAVAESPVGRGAYAAGERVMEETGPPSARYPTGGPWAGPEVGLVREELGRQQQLREFEQESGLTLQDFRRLVDRAAQDQSLMPEALQAQAIYNAKMRESPIDTYARVPKELREGEEAKASLIQGIMSTALLPGAVSTSPLGLARAAASIAVDPGGLPFLAPEALGLAARGAGRVGRPSRLGLLEEGEAISSYAAPAPRGFAVPDPGYKVGTPEFHVEDLLRQEAQAQGTRTPELTREQIQSLPGMGGAFLDRLSEARDAIQAGLPSMRWYNDLARQVLADTGQTINPQEALVLMGAFGGNAGVKANYHAMLSVFDAMRRGAPDLTDFEKLDKKAIQQTAAFKAVQDLVKADKAYVSPDDLANVMRGYRTGQIPIPSGAKLSSYTQNFIHALQSLFDPFTTQDVWQGRLWGSRVGPDGKLLAGTPDVAAKDQTYRSMHALTNWVARELDINPREAQAAGWVTMRTLWNDSDIGPLLKTGQMSLGDAVRRGLDKGILGESLSDNVGEVVGRSVKPDAWDAKIQAVRDRVRGSTFDTPPPPTATAVDRMALRYEGAGAGTRVADIRRPVGSPEATELRDVAAMQAPVVRVPGQVEVDPETGRIPWLQPEHAVQRVGDETVVTVTGVGQPAAEAIAHRLGASSFTINTPDGDHVAGFLIKPPEGVPRFDQISTDALVRSLRARGVAATVAEGGGFVRVPAITEDLRTLDGILESAATEAGLDPAARKSAYLGVAHDLPVGPGVSETAGLRPGAAGGPGVPGSDVPGTYAGDVRRRIFAGPSLADEASRLAGGAAGREGGGLPGAALSLLERAGDARGLAARTGRGALEGATAAGVEQYREQGQVTPETLLGGAVLGAGRRAVGTRGTARAARIVDDSGKVLGKDREGIFLPGMRAAGEEVPRIAIPGAREPGTLSQILDPQGRLLSTGAEGVGKFGETDINARTLLGAHKAGNVDQVLENMPNLKHLANDMPDVQDTIRRLVEENPEAFEKARGGRVSFEEQKRLAAALGMSADDFLKSKVGKAYNAQEQLALRSAAVDTTRGAIDATRAIREAGGLNAATPEQKLEAMLKLTKATNLQLAAKSGGSTAARTLGQQRINVTRELSQRIAGANEAKAAERVARRAGTRIERTDEALRRVGTMSEERKAALARAAEERRTLARSARDQKAREAVEARSKATMEEINKAYEDLAKYQSMSLSEKDELYLARQAERKARDEARAAALASKEPNAFEDLLSSLRDELKAEEKYFSGQRKTWIKMAEDADEVKDLQRLKEAEGIQGIEGRTAWLKSEAKGARALQNQAEKTANRAYRAREYEVERAQKVLDSLGGKRVTDKVLSDFMKVIDSDDPMAIAKFIGGLKDTNWWERSDILRYAGMLSSLFTQTVQVVGGATNLGLQIPAHALAVPFDIAAGALRGGERTRYMGEIPEMVKGWAPGFKSALPEAAEVLKTGINPRAVADTNINRLKGGFQSERSPLARALVTGTYGGLAGGLTTPEGAPPEERWKRIGLGAAGAGGIGAVARGPKAGAAIDAAAEWPLRVMQAADLLVRGTARGGASRAGALRQSLNEGWRGADAGRRQEDILRNLVDFPDLMGEAENTARRVVLQEDRNIISRIPRSGVEGRVLSQAIPFVRTPVNVVAQGMGMTPAGVLGAINAAQRGERGEAVDRIGRALVGSAIIGGGILIGKDHLTGAYPTEEWERSALPPNWRPWSFKVSKPDGEDVYVPFQALGGPGVPLAIAAAATEDARHGKEWSPETMGKASLAVGRYMADQAMLIGFNNAVNTIVDPDRYGERFLESVASQYAPLSGASRQITQIRDIGPRDPNNPLEAILAAFAPTAELVQPRLDRLGREVPPSMSGAGALVAPVRYSTSRDEPVLQAFREAEVNMPEAPKEILGVPLTDQEQRTVQQISGLYIEQAVQKYLADRPNATPEQRQFALKKIVEDMRAKAGGEFLRTIPLEERRARAARAREQKLPGR